MNINRIEFIVTWQCGGRCKHCQIGDSINKPCSHRHILSDYATETIQKLNEVFEIESVMTFGGEPLYYPKVAAKIHETATECGIKTRQILTNGYFTNSPEESRNASESLAEAGVNSLLLSVDAFHQEHIPVEPVLRFAKDIVTAKIPNTFLYPAWLVNERHQNEYNVKTNEILDKFSDISIPIRKGNNIFLGGSASRFLHEYYKITDDYLSTPCLEPLTDIKSISIVPNGDVMVCGFVIGNIYKEDIYDIVARYNPYENEYMLTIVNGGVLSLATYAKSKGIEVDTSEYLTSCDLCHAITKQINK